MVRSWWRWLAVLVLGGGLAATTPAPSRAAEMKPMDADVPHADSVLTLAWIERTVLERNPTLAAARSAWREAEARAQRSPALPDPMADFVLAPRSLGSSTVDPAYRVDIRQRLPLFGQRGLERRGLESEGEAAGYDYQTARLDLLRDARVAYYEYYRVARSLEINHDLLDLVRHFREVALAKYAAGTVGQTDPLQADVELAMLNHETASLARERRIVVARLKALLHLPQEMALPEPPGDTAPPDMPSAAERRAALTAAAWPELSAAQARVAARRAQVTLARRQRLPEWTLGAAYDRFWSEPELRTSVALSLDLPLNLGRLRSAEREARAGLELAEAQRAAARDGAELRVEESSASLEESLHELEIMQDQVVPTSVRTVQAVRAAYEANRSDFYALLNAQRDLARARLGYYAALVRAHQARAELRRALASDAPAPGAGARP